ncbi:MAG: hypothetical protein AAF640_10660 [Pseudomonadota bacterium]
MMHILKRAAAACVFCLALPAFGQDPDNASVSFPDEEQRSMAMEEVPPAVMATARNVAPDVFFTSAESYWRDDMREYHLRGRLFREVWDVFIREDGKFVRKSADNQDS